MRLTVRPSDRGATIKLEGTLAGPSVHALARLWKRIRAVHLHNGTTVDLASLGSIDSHGARLLRQMRRDGAEVAGGPVPA